VLGREGIGHLPVFAERSGGAHLVVPHETGIACDVSRQYRRQSPLDALARHEAPIG
jgi:hypothetical protein